MGSAALPDTLDAILFHIEEGISGTIPFSWQNLCSLVAKGFSLSWNGDVESSMK